MGLFQVYRINGSFCPGLILAALLNLRVLLRLDSLESLEELCRIEGFELIVSAGALCESGRHYGNNRHRWIEELDLTGELGTRNIVQTSVQDDSIDGWKALEGFQSFLAAIGCDDVEPCGLNDQLPG